MGLSITYTCNWCNTNIPVTTADLPKGWLSYPIHDPLTSADTDGSFCKEACQTAYLKQEPAAIEHARRKYCEEFWSFLNKAKNEVS